MSQRTLGLRSATATVVASMIGTGVFVTTGEIAASFRSAGGVLLVWALGGLLAACGAVCYGALARRFPESGGEYLFLSRCWHPALGWMAGWVSLFVGFSAPLALSAWAFGSFVEPWTGIEDPRWAATALLVGVATVHGAGVRVGADVQDAWVFLKLLLILGFVVFGFLEPVTPRSQNGPASAAAGDGGSVFDLGLALLQVSFAYSGWNAAVYIAGEVREPRRTLPRALLLGCTLVSVLYLALQTVFLRAVPVEEAAGSITLGVDVARVLGGESLARAAGFLIALALVTTASAMTMLGPRVYARMADDGYLPRWFRTPEAAPPRGSILLQLVVALLMLWTSAFGDLLTYVGVTLSLSAACTVVGLLRLQARPDQTAEGAAVRTAAWIFVCMVAATTLFGVWQRPAAAFASLGTLALGLFAWSVTKGRWMGLR